MKGGASTPEERDAADRRGVLTEVARYRMMTRTQLLRVRAAPTEKRIRAALRTLERVGYLDITEAERQGGTEPTRTESLIYLTKPGELAAAEMGLEQAWGSKRTIRTGNEVEHRVAIVDAHIALRAWAGDWLEEIIVDFEPGSGGRHKSTRIDIGADEIVPDTVAALVFPGTEEPQVVVLEVERGGRRSDLSGFFREKLPRLRKAADTRLVERRTGNEDPVRFVVIFQTREVRDKALARWPDPDAEEWGLFYVKALADVTGPDFNGGWMRPGETDPVPLFAGL